MFVLETKVFHIQCDRYTDRWGEVSLPGCGCVRGGRRCRGSRGALPVASRPARQGGCRRRPSRRQTSTPIRHTRTTTTTGKTSRGRAHNRHQMVNNSQRAISHNSTTTLWTIWWTTKQQVVRIKWTSGWKMCRARIDRMRDWGGRRSKCNAIQQAKGERWLTLVDTPDNRRRYWSIQKITWTQQTTNLWINF